MPYKRKQSRYWWVDFTDASGTRVRRSTGATTRKEAKALEAKWKLEAYKEKQWNEEPQRTFDELMLNYLKATETTKATHGRDRCSMKHLYPVFTGKSVADIDTITIRGYIKQRKAEGAAASTINKEVGLMSVAINYARKEWGWNLPNPVQGNRVPEPEGRVRWITREEAQALIVAAGCESRAPHLPDFLRLALHTGMRRGEMLGLEWRRVDLRSDLVYLNPQHTKTKRRRSIPINAVAKDALLGRARFRAVHCPDSPWVFCHRDGRRIGDIKHAFTSACRRAGIEDFRIHDLRHTCAAWLVQAGAALDRVRDLLGHTSVATTEIYAHLAPENVREAVNTLASTSHFRHSGDSSNKQSSLSR